MSQFVFDQILQFIDGHISIQSDPVQYGLSYSQYSLRELEKIRLLKLGAGFVIKNGNGCREVVLCALAYPVIGALSKLCDSFQKIDIIHIIVQFKMLCLIAFPFKVFITDFVFTIIRVIKTLC